MKTQILPAPSKSAMFIARFRNRWKQRMIRALGGYDQLTACFLLHQANHLTELVQRGTFPPDVKMVVDKKVTAIHQATLRLDTLYGINRGYHREQF